MAKTDNKPKGAVEAKKLAIGERVEFSKYVIRYAETRYGQAVIVNFAGTDRKIHRKCFAQGGMLEWLKTNPQAKSITLAEKLVDGDLTYNVWSE